MGYLRTVPSQRNLGLLSDDTHQLTLLVSGYGIACQQEISLVLAKTPPIHYETVMDSTFSIYAG